MEQGNEGDAIILLAFRQIDCQITEDVQSVSQLSPELIVEIVARSLLLMSEGEVKVIQYRMTNVAIYPAD